MNDAKETIVPSYVTQNGYTKEIPSRRKLEGQMAIIRFMFLIN